MVEVTAPQGRFLAWGCELEAFLVTGITGPGLRGQLRLECAIHAQEPSPSGVPSWPSPCGTPWASRETGPRASALAEVGQASPAPARLPTGLPVTPARTPTGDAGQHVPPGPLVPMQPRANGLGTQPTTA